MEHVVKRARRAGHDVYFPHLSTFFSRGPRFSALLEHTSEDSSVSSMFLAREATVTSIFVAAACACAAVTAIESVPAPAKERKPRSLAGDFGTAEERKAKQNEQMIIVMKQLVDAPVVFKKEFRLHPEDFCITLNRIRHLTTEKDRETSIDPLIK